MKAKIDFFQTLQVLRSPVVRLCALESVRRVTITDPLLKLSRRIPVHESFARRADPAFVAALSSKLEGVQGEAFYAALERELEGNADFEVRMVEVRVGKEKHLSAVLISRAENIGNAPTLVVCIEGTWKEPALLLEQKTAAEKTAGVHAIGTGIAAAPGVAMGKAYILEAWERRFILQDHRIEDVERAIERFHDALARTATDVASLRQKIEAEEQPGASRDQKLEMLRKVESFLADRGFRRRVEAKIRGEKLNGASAIYQVTQETIDHLLTSGDELLRDRAAEMETMRRFVLRNYLNLPADTLFLPDFQAGDDIVLAAPALDPGDTLQINPKAVSGIVTDTGGRTSHAAVMASGMGIPACVGVKFVLEGGVHRPATAVIREGDTVIVDARNGQGKVIINPTKTELRDYRALMAKATKAATKASREYAPATTLDGERFSVLANISFAGKLEEEIAGVEGVADGVGLARLENLYMGGVRPSREELREVMQRLAQAFAPRPVTVRFLDNIDVQRPGFVPEGSERNPALGERGVRFLLKEPARSEILYAQIWAAMTANHNLGNLRVMVPMVSVPEEMVEVKKAMDEVEAGIKQKKIPYQRPLLGMMVEVPAAALAVERFVALVDFISLGTNDLVQYLMAAARDNSAVSPLAHDFSPAVVWTVRRAIKSARNTAGGMKKPDFRVGICGEMARNPLAVALLLGLGVDSFSVSPRFVPGVKEVIAKLDLKDCRDLAVGLRKEMAGGRVGEPKQIEAFIRSRFPQVFAA